MEALSVYEVPFFCEDRYLIMRGGAGSGKSVFAAQKIVARCVLEKNHRFLVTRKIARTLRNSVWQLLLDVIKKEEIKCAQNKSEMRLTFSTGSEIICAGLDDSEKIKSIAGITGIWCEEVTEFEELDLDQLDLRLRGQTASYKQIIMTFNPIDSEHWIKKKFYDREVLGASKYLTTYKDNKFLDDDYIRTLETTMRSNENLYKIYTLGEWGKVSFGGEFYKSFSFSKNIKHKSYNPELPLHITFDFNVNPHVSMSIFQTEGNNTVYQIDEIAAEFPHNNTKSACLEFVKRYYSHDSGLFVYGDPAGFHQDTRTESGYNDYSIIMKELEKYNPVNRTDKKAPPVVPRGAFINSIFSFCESVNVYISPSCKKTISDYSNVKEAADGTKKKDRKTDPNSKVSYEPYGHFSDANDYFICTYFAEQFDRYRYGKSGVPIITTHSITGF